MSGRDSVQSPVSCVLCHSVVTMFTTQLIIISVCLCQARGQPLSAGSRTVRYNSGGEAVISCSLSPAVTTATTKCDWLKEGWLLDLAGRYSSSHNCELVISPVLPVDQGQYQCQLGGSSPLKSPSVELSVNTEPSHPEIQQGDKMMVETGDTLELSCQASGAKPAADIEWWNVETGQRIEAEVRQHVVRTQSSFTSTSTIKLTLSSQMSVRCSASSDQFPDKKFSKPLELRLTGQLTRLEVAAGDSLTLDCETGRPGDRYDWYLNNGPLPGEHQQLLQLNNFAPSFDGAVIACEVQGKLIKRFKLSLMVESKSTTNNIKQKSKGKIKTLYTCIFTDHFEGEMVPSSVVFTGETKKIQVAEDELNRKFRCRRFSTNKVKFYQIQNILKSYGTKIKKIQKQLNQMLKSLK